MTSERKAVEKRHQKEVTRYKPVDKENQKAVAAITKHLNTETAKQSNTKCQWKTCQFEADHPSQLFRHLLKAHHYPQIKSNKHTEPVDRRYHCEWSGCGRRKPFKTQHRMYRHLKSHVTTAAAARRLQITRDQLLNSVRPPTGRRWSTESKEAALENYMSRKTWMNGQSASGVPMMSLGTVLKEKNRASGGLPGIDRHVMEKLSELCKSDPKFNTGTLVFDEVSMHISS